ncbi:phage portal protein [Acuticoccus sp. I52.16.1]|uniref:phage portal protein n=1 Tax=Acuticoccus sp. I52.16.1 TaxID=2928472 RepID=UPI001FD437D5|nr:phage portal protein [Acuticoccus sp. I52.16.1]UOM33823.1 phage portal protein [Acuticoccus sp. I52.16.1]
MGIFGKRETKASRVGRLMSVEALGRPVWTPRDYASLAQEGFAKNPVVFRSVRMIAEAAASAPWLLYEGEREIEAHPFLDMLRRPNPAQSGVSLMETVYGHLMVAGNAYLEVVSLDGVPRELFALRPDRMKVVAGPDGWPQAFEYAVAGRTVRFAQEGDVPPVLHLSLFHPLNDHYGFAPIEAAQISLDIHNASGAWSKALLDNAARPSGALVYNGEGPLNDEQFERLKTELEEGYTGARNAGRPLLLEGGLDWKTMAMSPRDMDFIEAKNQAAREIALAFGVPPMLLGIPGDNTYANYREANRAFWRQTVLPLVNRTVQAMGNWLGLAYGPDLRLAFDPDGVEALSVERDALWDRVAASDFLTRDEKRAAVGYGIDGHGDTGDGGDAGPD